MRRALKMAPKIESSGAALPALLREDLELGGQGGEGSSAGREGTARVVPQELLRAQTWSISAAEPSACLHFPRSGPEV